jgi:bis(5'-adenosyl)-triphosphatase
VNDSVFYDNNDFLAIYNIAPFLPGHSLIIPRVHHTSLLALSNTELTAFFHTARIALRILLKTFQTEAFDWSIQEKQEAGQTIEHLHLHIVPRVKNDLAHPGDWYPLVKQNDMMVIDSTIRTRLTSPEMKQIVEKLREMAVHI